MNPTAIVTGGSRGIGKGIVLELAKAGFDLAINFASNADAAALAAKEAVAAANAEGKSIRAEICQADISHGDGRKRLIEFARDRFAELNLLVNNAGVAPQVRADLLDVSEESLDRLMNINLKGPFFLTQLAAKWMLESAPRLAAKKKPAHSPKIVTITSISAYAASVDRGDYCLSKSALSMLTPLFATRLAAHGIQVFELRPGVIETDMTAPVKSKYDKLISEGLTPMPRWGTPEDVGKAVVAIATGLFPFSTGEVLNIDGGFHLRRL
jgi:NAD(P)-dependent dehydrogenase (short-subunit alcohol dehydrogenase family)